MKIINNKQLEDVLSIDQPSKSTNHQSSDAVNNKGSAEGGIGGSAGTNGNRGGGVGPAPTKTVSTVASATNGSASKSPTTNNRQRRRTISYWGNKAPPPPPSKSTSQQEIDGLATKEEKRRHSSIVQNATPPQPERSMSTTTTGSNSSTNGGWAKALRRMSGIGWATVKEEPVSAPPAPVIVSNDSAVGSLSEDDNVENASRKSSGSSTPSIRRSNELGTLSEE